MNTILPIDTKYIYNTLKILKENNYKLSICLPFETSNDHFGGYDTKYFNGINIVKYLTYIQDNYDFQDGYIFTSLENTLQFLLLFSNEIETDVDIYVINRCLYEIICYWDFNNPIIQKEIKENNDLLKEYYQNFCYGRTNFNLITIPVMALFQNGIIDSKTYLEYMQSMTINNQDLFLNYIYNKEIKRKLNTIFLLKRGE